LRDSRDTYQYLELIHAAIDGEASRDQVAALREYLAHHPEAQSVHAEMVKLTNILNQVEEIEAPGDLRGSILAALPLQCSTVEIGVRSNRWRLRIPLIRYGYALAAGLLLGVVLTGVVFKNLAPVEKSAVYGTMRAVDNASRYAVTERMTLAALGVAGSVELSRSGDNEMVVFDLNGEAVDVEVGFDGTQADILGFSQQPNGIRFFEAKDSSISFRSGGKQRSTVRLTSRNAQLPLSLRFYVGGKLVHQGTLGAAAPTGSAK